MKNDIAHADRMQKVFVGHRNGWKNERYKYNRFIGPIALSPQLTLVEFGQKSFSDRALMWSHHSTISKDA
jgi:hypothetical protein